MSEEEIKLLIEFTKIKDATEVEELKRLVSVLLENLDRHLDVVH